MKRWSIPLVVPAHKNEVLGLVLVTSKGAELSYQLLASILLPAGDMQRT